MKSFSKILIPTLVFSFGVNSYVFADWETKFLPDLADAATNDEFGQAVAIDGEYAVIGSYKDDDNGTDSGSAYLLKRDGQDWIFLQKITASDGEANDKFGYSVDIDGSYVIIGAYGDDDNGNSAGAAYIFKRSGSTLTEEAKIIGSNTGSSDQFGISVGISGDNVIVGAPKDYFTDGSNNGSQAGSAYIFNRSGTTWTEQAKLNASDPAYKAYFGSNVAIDGNYAVVGAYGFSSTRGKAYVFNYSSSTWSEQDNFQPSDVSLNDEFTRGVAIDGDYIIAGSYQDDDGGSKSGSAYIFKRSSSTWSQQQKLVASDDSASDRFGYSVSISGSYAIIGSYGDDDNGNETGSAYIFNRSGSSWSETDKFNAIDPGNNDRFGFAVDIDGDYMVIGNYRDDDDGSNSGSAYFFHKTQPWDFKVTARLRAYYGYFGSEVAVDEDDFLSANATETVYAFNKSGNSWSQVGELNASDFEDGDDFGESVAVSGNYAIIGAPLNDDDGSNSGSAYIFEKTGTTWAEEAKIVSSTISNYDRFGHSVDIDGDYAIVGAYFDNFGKGSAFIFLRNGDSWTEQALLSASDAAGSDYLGYSVSISGEYAIVGAYQDDDSGTSSGSAYIFKRDGTNWTEQAKLTASDGAADDRFGWSVSIDGDFAVVGSYYDDDDGSKSGSAYVFERNGTNWTEVTKLVASNANSGDEFGEEVAISGDRIVVGAKNQDVGGTNTGSVFVFENNGSNWVETTIIGASDATPVVNLGNSVAIYENYVVAGAYQDDEWGDQSGSAYLFIVEPFIDGNVTQTVNGNATYSFNDGSNEDTGLDIGFTGVSNTADIQCESFSETPATTDGISGTVQPVRWEITDGGLAFTNAEIRIDMTTLPVTIDFPSAAVIYHRSTPGSGNFTALATTVDGNELVGNTASFSEFAIGGGDEPLSVELQNFSARQIENTIQLSWTTASETENEGFNVYRKTDESNFVQIASFRTHEELLGQGNTTGQTNYIFVDDSELKVNETYTYYISDVEFNGLETKHEDLEQSVVFGVDSEVVRKFELAQNFPNPFNPTTTLQFQVAKDSRVSLKIYNILGKEVKTLVNEVKVAGNYDVKWDGLNNKNEPVSTGVYFAKIQAGSFSKIVKMSLLK